MVSKNRHILKTLTWRVIGTIDTIVLSWFITGSLTLGFSIGGVEGITKMVLYYLHERAWYKFSDYGVNKKEEKK